MDRTPSVKKHSNGRWGLYIGEHLLGTAKTEVRADIGLRLLESAFADVRGDAYSDGYDIGYYEGAHEHF